MFTENEETSQGRIVILQIICIAAIAIYVLKLFSMQILEGDVYRSIAQNITRRTSVIPAQRGEIYDRTYTQPLVLNTDSFAVSVTPAEVPKGAMPDLIARLASLLDVSRDQIEKKLPSSIYYLYQPIEVAVNIPFKTIAVLAEQVNTLPGVSWQSKPMRNYTETGSLSHIIGYVGGITKDELTMLYNKGYQAGDMIGKNGIEKQYDEILRGRDGWETRTVDVRGRGVAEDGNVRQSPVMGQNLALTIDSRIQTLAEKALGKRIGAVVVMRPTTGEILAMVSYPSYNPNIFSQSDLGAEYQALLDDPNKPLINRAIQSSYPPASTFKIIMSTGIYAEDAFPPDQTVDCPGEITYGDRLWRCWIRRPGHGPMNLHQAMAQSCDIYYWTVGRDYLGIENIVNYSRDYGYGDLTGIDLPGEISGFIPTPQWKERRYHDRWDGGDTMNMSIGQGYTLVTPIQMADMTSMVVNKGIIYEPHLLKEIRDPVTGAVVQSVEPKILHQSTIAPEVFESVADDMRGVISEGTAQYPLNIKAVQIAGKTGTGEVGLVDQWHSWFTSFAPYKTDNPDERVVVTVLVEAVNQWEWWAPYASAIIYQGIFANQTYEEAARTLGIQNTQPIEGRRE
ncbi:MAG: penicillin-binding protein 2 [Treponema sp.]|nr:penicillin-binding protein 2 [Treponema sp.]